MKKQLITTKKNSKKKKRIKGKIEEYKKLINEKEEELKQNKINWRYFKEKFVLINEIEQLNKKTNN